MRNLLLLARSTQYELRTFIAKTLSSESDGLLTILSP